MSLWSKILLVSHVWVNHKNPKNQDAISASLVATASNEVMCCQLWPYSLPSHCRVGELEGREGGRLLETPVLWRCTLSQRGPASDAAMEQRASRLTSSSSISLLSSSPDRALHRHVFVLRQERGSGISKGQRTLTLTFNLKCSEKWSGLCFIWSQRLLYLWRNPLQWPV